ncbi:MAG: PAS domain S-box protein [Xanthobacteraceae bacterium]
MTDTFTSRTPIPGNAILFAAPTDAEARDDYFRKILDDLPAAIYVTDALGRITYFNEAAATLWGHRPAIGTSEWCGSWKLFWPNGRALPHGECPMAIAIKEKRQVRGMEAIAERPDGTRVPFIPYPTPLFDASGTLIGAVKMLIDITDRKRAEEIKQRLAAIVQFSDDGIISKNLDGIIESWNAGAERIFGYTAKEAIGQSIEMLIPPDRLHEEPAIIARIRRGERIDHYETVRRRKDGSLIDISLTVSPIMNEDGAVIGASKIARDVTERRKAREQRELLFREMDHRIRNLFTLAGSVVTLSARSADTPKELTLIIRDRLDALARAHALTLPKHFAGSDQTEQSTTLQSLIRAIASPYEEKGAPSRVEIKGTDVPVAASLATGFALVLHEFATNAAKYGALSVPTGRVNITCSETNELVSLIWTESGGPQIDMPPVSEGFGSQLAHATITGRLGGTLSRDWNADGLTIRLSVARHRLVT